SFGVVLYEMLSGVRPFAGENSMDVLASIVADVPRPLRELRSSLPFEIEQIVARALQKDREKRYQTASEVLAELKALLKRTEFQAEIGRSAQPSEAVEVETQIILGDKFVPDPRFQDLGRHVGISEPNILNETHDPPTAARASSRSVSASELRAQLR